MIEELSHGYVISYRQINTYGRKSHRGYVISYTQINAQMIEELSHKGCLNAQMIEELSHKGCLDGVE
jgi:hypothetical protein